jgi:hypothetical protein
MARAAVWASVVAAVAMAENNAAPAAGPTNATAPAIRDLGSQRYQIGNIVIDKMAGRITIPGRILRTTGPLEYFAAAPGGLKAYETLLELETRGAEFNLACILVGLDAAHSQLTQYQFDRHPAEGQLVELTVSWRVDGEERSAAATELLLTDAQREEQAKAGDDWVYTGSMTDKTGAVYAAEQTGTLIGFVHDPLTIIEHRTGLGIGAYGFIAGNPALLPPVDTPIVLTVTVTGALSAGVKARGN